MELWKPPIELSPREKMIMKRLVRVRPLFGFLRTSRHVLFDGAFQEQLAAMYRQTGAGEAPCAPAMLCLVLLLQGYVGASDAEAVEMSVMDMRWQMVLGCLGAESPPFSQGALQMFRQRMVESEMDRVLLERTVAMVKDGVANKAEGVALTKAVRVAIDSRPLTCAGKVEDTINLLGHAGNSIVRLASRQLGCTPEEVCKRARSPLFAGPSVKGGLDIDWSDSKQKATGIIIVERQLALLHTWLERELDLHERGPLQFYVDAAQKVHLQNLETDELGVVKIRQGVARDRRISIEDEEARHGRKSKSKRFDGFKEHIARDLDVPAILACAVTPANHPEEEGAQPIADDIAKQGFVIEEAHIDRAYVNSPVMAQIVARGGEVLAKPWGQRPHRPGLFTKNDFKIDLRSKTITCPAGEVESFEPGDTVHFDPDACGACSLRATCTAAASGRGRSVSIHADEAQQKKYRALQASPAGRARLRERVAVEHALARIAARKGPTARYLGVRKNLFDLRRASAIQNLEGLHQIQREAA